ncbi:Rha family transcriptional regulator, partial [Bartonella queenslandensis]|uniref:Rha family transcriptional regulator n=1 Tax=Bartonella queenslandensis TaxID=481138 RepID=UPI0018DBE4AD
MAHNINSVPIVFIQNGKVFANSKDVAEYFGKQHKNIIRDIEGLTANGCRLNFEQTEVFRDSPLGRGEISSKAYNMDRDGFTLLAMGFTGEKALKFKLAYIAQFNEMEKAIKSQSLAVDYSDPKLILGVVTHLQEESAKKDEVIADLKPKAVAY